MKKIIICIITFLLLSCNSQLQKPPYVEPTIIEQRIAEPLNYCQRGKYYAMIKYRHDMLFYLNSNDKEVALQAAKNLKIINNMIDEMTVLGLNNISCLY